jgi:protein O-mannosyl-transferase
LGFKLVDTDNPPSPKAKLAVLSRRLNRDFWAGVVLALLTLGVFWPVTWHGFTCYDDPDYVTNNPHVQAGLTWQGLSWAFGQLHGEHTYWHPLTWVSHMVDYQLFGSEPAGHHLVNVLFHALNAVLVFLVFRRMTRAFWRCAVLAGLFALHPLQVDTVAWVAERKNLLSAFFWLLAMWAYAGYAEGRRRKAECRIQDAQAGNGDGTSPLTPHDSKFDLPAFIFYLLSLLFCALGLMCKPVLVTLPFVLLLLDYWPLQRLRLSTLNAQPSTLRRLVAEKVPFFLLATVSSVITIFGHRALMGLVGAAAGLPLQARIENALISYVRYLGKTVWPSRLAVFYPHPVSWAIWIVVLSTLLLLALSALAVANARRRPYLFVGWFWFLGVLVPFNGLIQAGSQAMADRFAYVPLLGLFLALVWGVYDLAARWRYHAFALPACATAAALLCLALTRQQVAYWKDDETLFRHALAVTENNAEAHYNLGMRLASRGAFDEAIRHYEEAIRIIPEDVDSHNGLGYALTVKGRLAEAMDQFRASLRLNPRDAPAHNNLGNLLARQHRVDEAIQHFTESLRWDTNNPEAHYNLGLALAGRGSYPEAIAHYRAALEVWPDRTNVRNDLGEALARAGQIAEAIRQYLLVLQQNPGDLRVRCSLGSAFTRQERLSEALEQYREAARLAPNSAETQYQLGIVFAKKQDWPDAARQFRLALQLDPNFAAAHYQLGMVFLLQRQMAETIEQWREAARLSPDWPDPLNNLAWVLATAPGPGLRDGPEAVRLATRARELAGTNDIRVLDTLAAAYAETGRFADATNTIQEAITLAQAAQATNSVADFRRRLQLYQSQQPYRSE